MNGLIPKGDLSAHVASSSNERTPQRQAAFPQLEDRQFLAMDRAYFAHGGLAEGGEVARRMRLGADQPLSTLARWIVSRAIVHFEWHRSTLIPLFQFNLSDMSVRRPVACILSELAPAFDDWDIALWFAQPNGWLRERAPVEALETHPLEVVHAARADRFVARG